MMRQLSVQKQQKKGKKEQKMCVIQLTEGTVQLHKTH